MDSDPHRGKRSAECEMTEQALCSKRPEIASTSFTTGAAFNATDNAQVTIHNINMQHRQDSTPLQRPRGIKFQVADPIPTFRGRHKQLKKAKEAFSHQQNMEPYNLVAVCGYGGTGKTQFARKYIKENQADFENIVYIHAESEATRQESFRQLQNMLTDRGYRCYGQQDVYKLLNNDMTIFIFDNCEDIRSIQAYLPTEYNSSLFLVTSKSKNWHTFKKIELSELKHKEAVDLMKTILVDNHKIHISNKELNELVRKFEAIPLVLQIRAAFICRQVKILIKRGKEYNIEKIIKEMYIKPDFVTDTFHNFFLDPYDKSIFAAVYQSLEKIVSGKDETSIIAAKMLGISAYLSADFIDENIFHRLLNIEEGIIFNDALDILDQFSLFQISSGIIQIHRTVQQCLQYYHKSNEYYLLTLPLLLSHKFRCEMQHETILKHGEKDIESLSTFYEENNCYKLQKAIVQSASSKVITHLLNNSKVNLAHNPKFLCELAVCKQNDNRQALRDNKIDINVKDEAGFGVVHYACLTEHVSKSWDRIKSVIELGADINSQNSAGCTPLHTCQLDKNNTGEDEDIFNISALLIAQGANHKLPNNAGQTPADLARMSGLPLTLELLDSVVPEDRNLPHIVAKYQQYRLLKKLVIKGKFDINHQDRSGCTIFHVLAGLPQLDDNNENKLLRKTISLLEEYCEHDIGINASVKNNDGKTAMEVARQCGREKLANVFTAFDQPGRIIYQTLALRGFQFVSTGDKKHVDEQNDNEFTLLHALCDLDIELEEDIVKLAAHLVIKYEANVHIRNKKNNTAAEVARCHNHSLLADFLDCRASESFGDGIDLLYVALKHKEFGLVKYAWWRYLYMSSCHILYGFEAILGCCALRILCESEDAAVTDAELISLIDYMNLQQVAKYNNDEYHRLVASARQHGREDLAVWLHAQVPNKICHC